MSPRTEILEQYAESTIPTERGPFRFRVFRERSTGEEHLAIFKGNLRGREGVLTRLHSECLTSEVFGSLKCDCRKQLDGALEAVGNSDHGVVLYLRQEGRGIGLGNKIRAYALQEQGLDTYEANLRLGFAEDLRTYDVAAQMLRMLGVCSVQLITNNPLKIAALIEEGIEVRDRISLNTGHNPHNLDYLRTKRDQTGHLLDLIDPNGPLASVG